MSFWVWVGFIAFIFLMLAIDLGVLNRKAKVISAPEALVWTSFCAVLALLFGVGVYYIFEKQLWGITSTIGGRQAMLEFYTGWLIEQSLSLDNVLVIALIFAYFHVPLIYQHRVLFWGIMGALVMRGLMIAAGTALITRFDWITYVFGGLLVATAVKLLLISDDHIEPDRNPLVRLARRFYPVCPTYEEHHFFTQIEGRRACTPLFLVLLVVESTDVLFAVDSIPAIFAVTTDPFLVFTSNVFAILALRSLYFALAGVMDMFRYMKTSLVFVLAFVGVKMLLTHHYHIPTAVSLAVVGGILAVGVVASLWARRRHSALTDPLVAEEVTHLAQFGWRHAKRLVILVIGTTIIVIGIVGVFLPIMPGWVFLPVGLAILGTEFVWARNLLRQVKERAQRMTTWVGSNRASSTVTSSEPQSAAVDREEAPALHESRGTP